MAFKYIIRYQIPGLGTYQISKGPLGPRDSDLFRCWRRGVCIDSDLVSFDAAKQSLQAAIEGDLRQRVIVATNKLAELNQVLALTTQPDWLPGFTPDPNSEE